MAAFETIREEWNEVRDKTVPDFDNQFRACTYCPQARFSMVRLEKSVFVGVYCEMHGKAIDRYPHVCMGAEEGEEEAGAY